MCPWAMHCNMRVKKKCTEEPLTTEGCPPRALRERVLQKKKRDVILSQTATIHIQQGDSQGCIQAEMQIGIQKIKFCSLSVFALQHYCNFTGHLV